MKFNQLFSCRFIFILLLTAAAFYPRHVLVGQDTPPTKVRVSGKIMQAKLVHRVPATYPPEAKEKGIEGTVALEIIVGTSGDVEQIEVLSGNPTLARSAMDAVRHWKYEPTYVKGSPVRVVTRVDVSFRLPSQ